MLTIPPMIQQRLTKVKAKTKTFLTFIKVWCLIIYELFKVATENLGDALIPKKYRMHIRDYFRKAGINTVPYFRLGLLLYLAIILSFVIQILILRTALFANTGIQGKILITIIFVPILWIMLVAIMIFGTMLYVDILIKMRVNDMEESMPEFLSNLALNLRINTTVSVALENSATKELGVLADEINLVIKDMKMGSTDEQAIRSFMTKFNSDVINDSFELLLLSWKKGGNSAIIAERLYENMKSTNFLKDKVAASITSYKIFLTALALVIGPAMFALTFHLIDLIRRISKEISGIPDSVNLPFSMSEIRVNDSEFLLFATFCVIIIAVAIAFILAIVKTGKGNYALKQVLLYAILSIISFNIFLAIFKLFFAMFLI